MGTNTEACVDGPGIIVGRKGSVGAVTYSEDAFWPIDTTYFVVNRGGHDWRFLYHLLRSSGLTSLNSHSAVPGLNRKDVYSIAIRMPTIDEQKMIAKVLDCVEHSICTEEVALSHAQKLKQTAMRELFMRGLRGEPLKETEIGLSPQSWELTRLGELYETQLGKMLSQKARGGDSPKPYLRNKNVQWGRLDLSDLLVMDFNEREEAKFRLFPGDLLICEGGIIGRAAIWNGELEECYYQKALHRVRARTQAASNEFLCHWLSFSFEHQNLYNIGGASSTIAHLPQVLLDGLKIPLPGKDEQEEIVTILNAIDRKTDLHRQKRAVLEELFKSLLHKLMTGAIGVDELDLSALADIPGQKDIAAA